MTKMAYESAPSTLGYSTLQKWLVVNEETLRNLNKTGLLNVTYLQCEGMAEHIFFPRRGLG